MPVLVHFPHSMKRNTLRLALVVEQFKRSFAFRKSDFVKGYENNLIRHAIVIANLESATSEFGIPPDTAEQFVNRLHTA